MQDSRCPVGLLLPGLPGRNSLCSQSGDIAAEREAWWQAAGES